MKRAMSIVGAIPIALVAGFFGDTALVRVIASVAVMGYWIFIDKVSG